MNVLEEYLTLAINWARIVYATINPGLQGALGAAQVNGIVWRSIVNRYKRCAHQGRPLALAPSGLCH